MFLFRFIQTTQEGSPGRKKTVMKDMTTYQSYREFREAAGIHTDYAVARDSGVPAYRISRWKTRGWTPKYPDLKKICEFIGCTPDDIYRDEVM